MVRPVELRNKTIEGLRGRAASLVEHRYVTRFISWLIVINAITLGFETSNGFGDKYHVYLHLFDQTVVGIFVVELLLKLYAYGFRFFKVGWNIFDFIIVAISLSPNSGGLAILRSLRILRLLRLITLVPQMRKVIGGLFHAIPGMASITGVLLVIVYVFAVLGSQFFAQNDNELMQAYFGDVGNSMFTMFQLITLDDWSDIAKETIKLYPYAWMFFIPFIIITSFAVLNLFIGIIVDALNIVKEEDIKDEEQNVIGEIAKLNAKIDALTDEIRTLKA